MSKLIPNFSDFINEAAKYTDDKAIAVLAMQGFSLRDQIHLFHWQTEVGDKHKALGDYYDDFLEQLDGLMEVIMGKYGRISVKSVGSPQPLVDLSDVNVEEFVNSKVSIFENSKKLFAKDSEILNILDEIIAEIQKLKYLLTMS
jgi:DNA-binding ferritin-like protein